MAIDPHRLDYASTPDHWEPEMGWPLFVIGIIGGAVFVALVVVLLLVVALDPPR